jgi:large subunit ribosomal protein L32
MALPKRKTSKQRRDQRRAHDSIKPVTLSICKECGDYKKAHHVCPSCGRYKGKQVIKVK